MVASAAVVEQVRSADRSPLVVAQVLGRILSQYSVVGQFEADRETRRLVVRPPVQAVPVVEQVALVVVPSVPAAVVV